MIQDKLSEMPFSVDHLCNNAYKIEEVKPEWMEQSDYEHYLKDWNDRQSKVMFNNIMVNFESCDCGSEYGCSHADYPYDITFKDNEKIEAVFEDDGIYLSNDFGFVKFEKLKDITMLHFVDACALIRINLAPTEYYKSITV